MRYISTRGGCAPLDFESAMLTGLAPDGGLYVPDVWPVLADFERVAMKAQTYEEVAFTVMKPFIGDAFDNQTLRDLIASAYRGFAAIERAPLAEIEPNHYLLELYHGPTLAFKDFAMQLIGRMFDFSLQRADKRLCIVGATSGDTGSAAIEAFQNLASVDVFILYPAGRVSDVQRRQMTTASALNVHAVAIDGDFDDCQALVKAMFADADFRDSVRLASVNSINWARILAQVVYYFWAVSRLDLGADLGAGGCASRVSFCVPTGNFGDIFAGFVAKKMGLPIDRLIIATNQNDILHRTVQTGDHKNTGVQPTISPSMDIQISSNFERLVFELYGRDPASVRDLFADLTAQGGFVLSGEAHAKLCKEFASGRCSEQETLDTIARIYEKAGRMICPHTAVAVKVAGDFIADADSDSPIISLATAHAAKFPDAVKRACKTAPDLPPHLADLGDRFERLATCQNDLSAIQSFINDRLNT